MVRNTQSFDTVCLNSFPDMSQTAPPAADDAETRSHTHGLEPGPKSCMMPVRRAIADAPTFDNSTAMADFRPVSGKGVAER